MGPPVDVHEGYVKNRLHPHVSSLLIIIHLRIIRTLCVTNGVTLSIHHIPSVIDIWADRCTTRPPIVYPFRTKLISPPVDVNEGYDEHRLQLHVPSPRIIQQLRTLRTLCVANVVTLSTHHIKYVIDIWEYRQEASLCPVSATWGLSLTATSLLLRRNRASSDSRWIRSINSGRGQWGIFACSLHEGGLLTTGRVLFVS